MEESNMNESLLSSSGFVIDNGRYSIESRVAPGVAPFFSMRKLRLIYNQLHSEQAFEYQNFDAFKHQVLNSVAPQMELNKWQAIAARR